MTYKLAFFYDYILGNIVLPNGLHPEMGIINYIHSIYSHRLDRQSFFDERFDDDNSALRSVFGTELGHMPSSIWNNGSYLKSPCFRHKLEVYENSVYFGERHTPRYIYPIKVTLHFDKFTGTDNIGSKLNGEFFWKHISSVALSHIRSKRATIFLDWSNENFIEKSEYDNLHHCLKLSGIPPSQVVLAVNSFNAQEIYESWFSPGERLLEVRNLPFLLSNISYHYYSNREARLEVQHWMKTKNTLRDNYFLFPIRRGRNHRLALLYSILSNNLIDKGNWSCHDAKTAGHINAVVTDFGLTGVSEISEKLSSMLPKSLTEEPGSNFNSVGGWNDSHAKPFENSYFYIASETYFHGEYKSLTEKVFKPIANYQPFLFLAFPGALKVLRDLGFKTFSGFINEEYDNEPSISKRIKIISDEILRLCSMSKEEIHNWYWDQKEILIHNRNHLTKIFVNEPYAENFMKYLQEKVDIK